MQARRALIPWWVEVASRLPGPVQPFVASLVGFYRFAAGIIVYDRRMVLATISRALRVSRPRSSWILLVAEANTARAHLEFATFERIPETGLRDWAEKHVQVDNLRALQRAIDANRPVLVLSTSFASHYYGLLSPQAAVLRRILVLQPSVALDALNAIGFYRKLELAGSARIETVPADSPYSMLKAIKLLKGGGAAVARFDSLPTESTSFLFSTMFGLEVAFPSNLLRMAELTGALILPVFVFRRGRGFVSKFGEPIDMPRSASPTDYLNAANRLNDQVSREIAQRPAAYTAWHGLYEKTKVAAELRSIVASESSSTSSASAELAA